jgi:hypothetical protein
VSFVPVARRPQPHTTVQVVLTTDELRALHTRLGLALKAALQGDHEPPEAIAAQV